MYLKLSSAPAAGDICVTFKVRNLSGEVTTYKMKKRAPFSQLFSSYAEEMGVPVEQIQFTFNGYRVKDTDTPMLLDVGEGHTIHAVSSITPMYEGPLDEAFELSDYFKMIEMPGKWLRIFTGARVVSYGFFTSVVPYGIMISV